MENLNVVIILVVILAGVYLMSIRQESFCPRGYCPDDLANEKIRQKHNQSKFPCVKKYSVMGYDNPYIYPYNYFWNQTSQLGQYKFPGWLRFISKEALGDQFPGYTFQ